MARRLQLRRARRGRIPLRVLLFGEPGSGKTGTALAVSHHLAVLLGHDPAEAVAVIDSEVVAADEDGELQGSAEKYNDEHCWCHACQHHGLVFGFRTVLLPEGHQSPDDYVEALSLCAEEKVPIVVVDSLTHAWLALLGTVDQMKAQSRRDPWLDARPMHNSLINALVTYPGHVIVTCRAKEKVDRSDAKDWKNLGLQPQQSADLKYQMDVAFLLSRAETYPAAGEDKTRAAILAGNYYRRPGQQMAMDLLTWSVGPTAQIDRAVLRVEGLVTQAREEAGDALADQIEALRQRAGRDLDKLTKAAAWAQDKIAAAKEGGGEPEPERPAPEPEPEPHQPERPERPVRQPQPPPPPQARGAGASRERHHQPAAGRAGRRRPT